MNELNIKPKTLFTEDNLPVLRGINSNSVDLIYLDPPFNSNANYAAPIGSQAAGAEFKDTWSLQDVDIAWLDLIELEHPKLNRVIHAAMTNSDKSYLIYMSIRLLEMHRILKDTGSLYLHCDPYMSHPLKMTLDAIFKKKNFQNEIVWNSASGKRNLVKQRYGRGHDTIFYYTKKIPKFNIQYTALTEEHIQHAYKKTDQTGKHYSSTDLTVRQGGHRYEFLGVIRNWQFPEEKMQQLLKEDRIIHKSITPNAKNSVPRYKKYLEESKGSPTLDNWTDIEPLASHAKERTGYRTQKPLALLDRIIKASSNEGDIVLDPFCGCATTLVAADRLNRKWIGIDCEDKAVKLLIQRIKDDQGLFEDIIHRTDIPKRTDLGDIRRYNHPENKKLLYGKYTGNCNGCQTHFEIQHLEIDHIIATSKGGTDHLENLQLLCSSCNRIKGNRGQAYLLARLNPQPQRRGNITY